MLAGKITSNHLLSAMKSGMRLGGEGDHVGGIICSF